MQKRVVLVSAAVTVLGLAAAVLGFVAESTKSKAFVGYVGQRCVYRRTPALFCGVAAALLALTALALATAVNGGCLRRNAPAAHPGRRRSAVKLSTLAWVIVVVAAVMFLYGAAMNRGGTRDLSTSRRGWGYGRRGYYYGCAVLKSGIFATASILAAVAAVCAVVAYVNFQRAEEPPALGAMQPTAHFVAHAQGGVAVGQPQWAQPYPAPPSSYPPPPHVAYPAPPPPPQYGGYGPKQPAGTA